MTAGNRNPNETGAENRRDRWPMATGSLERYVDEWIEDGVFKTRGEAAAACGMKDAAFSRALNHEGGRTLSVEQCLRLALRLTEHPAAVLRIAGRQDVARVVDDLWRRHTGSRDALTRREREHLALWRSANVSMRHAVDAILAQFVAEVAASARSAGTNGNGNNARVQRRARRSLRQAG